ncbi:MAG: site-specific integrase [Proteobacteria bacterium]|nr:MAG: site-specific integrase [Pseudomonadota bacterium]
MATIRKRGDFQWHVQVRKKGFPTQTRTFLQRVDAERWAKETEIQMERGLFFDRSVAEKTSVSDLTGIYRDQILPTKRGNHFVACLKAIDAEFGESAVVRVTSKSVATWRDRMAASGLAAGTIRKRLAVLSKLLDLAHREWGVALASNPVGSVSRPVERNHRDRRLVADEEERLLAAVTPAQPAAGPLIRLALATGARQGELWALEWSDIELSRRVMRVRGLSGEGSKNGEVREVPLSSSAMAVFESMPRPLHGGRVFACWGSSQAAHHMWAALLRRARRNYVDECKDKGADPDGRLSGLRFHDLRHEAASRMAEKLSVHELAKIMGWRSIQMAMRYYHPRVEELARKLG